MTTDAARWQRRLDELAARHRVPGASLAFLDRDEVTAGVVNRETGVRATPDAVFQITGTSYISAGVQAADLGGDGRDVDRPGRVHGD